MLQSVPQLASAKPRKLATFPCWQFLIVQVVGPQTLYLAETDTQLMITDDGGIIDALQINQASGIQRMWWKGDLWAAGSVVFKPLIVAPGITTGSTPSDSIPYGVVPSV